MGGGNLPHFAFFLYGSFHDERNAMTRAWRKNIYHPEYDFRVPYGALRQDSSVQIKYKGLHYSGLEIMKRSALVNAIDDALNKLLNTGVHQLTFPLFRLVKQLADEYGVNVVVCTLTNDEPTQNLIAWCRQNEVPVIDFSEIMNRSDCTCQPRDDHPNALAHQLFADSILTFIQR